MCLADFVTHSPRGPSSERRREVVRRDEVGTRGGFQTTEKRICAPSATKLRVLSELQRPQAKGSHYSAG